LSSAGSNVALLESLFGVLVVGIVCWLLVQSCCASFSLQMVDIISFLVPDFATFGELFVFLENCAIKMPLGFLEKF
ncbi:23490_t:CDS:2, partial [Dentiscutata erythropus]